MGAEKSDMEPRFLLDRNLVKLAKWLRILGYDASVGNEKTDMQFMRRAEKEKRIALVHKKRLIEPRHIAPVFVVEVDCLPDQLAQILFQLGIQPDPSKWMTRCLLCNVLLIPVAKEDVREAVPDYVQEKYDDFRRCPSCGRIYWPGTHVNNIQKALTLFHSRAGRPGSFRLHD
jgi:uncharacterized protein